MPTNATTPLMQAVPQTPTPVNQTLIDDLYIKVERVRGSVIYDLIFCTQNSNVAKIFGQLSAIMKEITPFLLIRLYA